MALNDIQEKTPNFKTLKDCAFGCCQSLIIWRQPTHREIKNWTPKHSGSKSSNHNPQKWPFEPLKKLLFLECYNCPIYSLVRLRKCFKTIGSRNWGQFLIARFCFWSFSGFFPFALLIEKLINVQGVNKGEFPFKKGVWELETVFQTTWKGKAEIPEGLFKSDLYVIPKAWGSNSLEL